MSSTQVDGVLKLTVDGPIAKIAIGAEPVNAVGSSLAASIEKALDMISRYQKLSVVRISSDLRVFSAGADLNEVNGFLSSDNPSRGMQNFVKALHRLNDRIEGFDAITIAEINGAAIGGGFELALACDFRLGSRRTKVGLPEAALGIIPGAGGTQRLKELTGISVARRLIYCCDIIDAETALAYGILDRIFDEADYESECLKFSSKISKLPRNALLSAKQCLGLSGPEGFKAEIANIAKLANGAEPRNRIAGFLKES